MSDTLTDAEWAEAFTAMRRAGARAGKAAGGWIADGNTSEESLRALLKMWDEGDPAAPVPPSPFSGEWAGDPSLEEVIDAETDIDVETIDPEEVSELGDAFEEEYCQAWHDEAERTVKAMLGIE